MRRRKVRLRHPGALHFVEDVYKGFPTSQGLGVTELEDIVLNNCDGKRTLFLLHGAQALICNKNEFFLRPALLSVRTFVTQSGTEGVRLPGWPGGGAWGPFLLMKISCKKVSARSIHNMLFNTLNLFKHYLPGGPGLHEGQSKSRNFHLISRVSKSFSTHRSETWTGIKTENRCQGFYNTCHIWKAESYACRYRCRLVTSVELCSSSKVDSQI